jgi:DNA-binding CsgD family transcriptional regulator
MLRLRISFIVVQIEALRPENFEKGRLWPGHDVCPIEYVNPHRYPPRAQGAGYGGLVLGGAMKPGENLLPKPQFTIFLSAFPHPATVPRALTLGPWSNFSTGGCFLAFPFETDYLRTMGAVGFTDEEMDRYSVIPLSIAAPMTESFLQSEVVIVPFVDLWDRYEVVRIDKELWDALGERFGDGDVVHAPIRAQGVTLGLVGFYTTESRTWDAKDIEFIQGVCASLGIWATHPLSGVQTPEIWRPVSSSVLALTDRQQEILRLIERGKSNASIAMSLGYSASTVKAEIQKALRALKVHDRVAAAKRARDLGLLEDEESVG